MQLMITARLTGVAVLIGILCVGLSCSRTPTAAELAKLNQELYRAVDHHDLASVRRLLKKGASIETTDGNGTTPLAAAASNGDVPMVQLLLQNGAKAHVKDRQLVSPLGHAARVGSAEIVRLLLKQNPDLAEKNQALLEAAHGEPAIVVEQDQSGKRLTTEQIMAKFESPWVDTVRLLLDSGANIEATDEYRGPPLVDAAAYAQTEVVIFLLSRGANLHARDKYGHTALISAACECAVATMNDAYYVVDVLLRKGSDVNAHANDGTTALMNAAGGFGGSAIVKLLLEHGADPRARDAEGKTALQFAIAANRADKVQLIRQALAKDRGR